MSRYILACLLAVCLHAADYDILIRNAHVIDGSGNPWFRADVGIRDGRIAAVGRLDGRSGYRTIDAAGRALAPGSSTSTPISKALSRRSRRAITTSGTVLPP